MLVGLLIVATRVIRNKNIFWRLPSNAGGKCDCASPVGCDFRGEKESSHPFQRLSTTWPNFYATSQMPLQSIPADDGGSVTDALRLFRTRLEIPTLLNMKLLSFLLALSIFAINVVFAQTVGTTGQFSDAAGWSQLVYYGSIRVADVNGDKLDDICGRGVAGIYCALNNGNGTFAQATLWTSQFSDALGWNFPQYATTIQFADLNGDGKADVCGRAVAGIFCSLSNGSSFGSLIPNVGGDFSDDSGWAQLIYYGSIRLADLNGDGKADICGRSSAGIYCALGNGNGTFAPGVLWTSQFSDALGWNLSQYATTIQFADLNGDGKADVCGRGGAGIFCSLSNGSSLGSLIPNVGGDFSDGSGWAQLIYYGSIRLADVNGDGKADICGRGSAGLYCGLGVGDGTFAPAALWSSQFSDALGWNFPQYATTIELGRIDASGTVDAFGRSATGVVFVSLPLWGYLSPKYEIVGVTYAPPGAQSYVTYDMSTLVGTTTSITSTFKNQTVSTSSFGISIGPIGATGSGDLSWTQTSQTSDSVSITESMDDFYKTLGPLNSFAAVDHDYDVIWLWLNPVLPLTIAPPTNPNGITWSGYGYDPRDQPGLDIVYVYVGWLNGDIPLSPSVSQQLARTWASGYQWGDGQGPGLTGPGPGTDFATIVQADPFWQCTPVPANCPTTPDPTRFTLSDNQNISYEQPPVGGQSVPQGYMLQYTNTSDHQQINTHEYSVGYGLDPKTTMDFSKIVTLDEKISHTLTWTSTTNAALTNTIKSTASASITGPTCTFTTGGTACNPTYVGPTKFDVYQDNEYGTFLFFPVGSVLPPPSTTQLNPASTAAGGSSFTISVSGSGFVLGSAVLWNGSALTTNYVSGSQLTALVPSNLTASPGSAAVSVQNPGGVTSTALTFTINPGGTLTINTTSPLPLGSVAVPYSQTLVASGGTTPYKSWTVVTGSGSLPPGISLTTSGGVLTGLLSGLPTTPGSFTFTVQVTDNTNATANKQFTLIIGSAPGVMGVGIFRSSNGLWLENSQFNNVFTSADTVTLFGGSGLTPQTGDIPVVGDWSGTGTSKIGLYRPSTGTWFLDYNGNGVYDGPTVDLQYQFGGIAGDIPVVGDWNGSGVGKVGIFRDGFFWLLDSNGNGDFDTGDQTFAYGGASGCTGPLPSFYSSEPAGSCDIPVVADWNKSGTTKVGIVRASPGTSQPFLWILDTTGAQKIILPGTGVTNSSTIFAFGGIQGDVPIVGDWTGSGNANIGVFRNGFLWVEDTTASMPMLPSANDTLVAFPYGGVPGDEPVIGRWP